MHANAWRGGALPPGARTNAPLRTKRNLNVRTENVEAGTGPPVECRSGPWSTGEGREARKTYGKPLVSRDALFQADEDRPDTHFEFCESSTQYSAALVKVYSPRYRVVT
jgi:hypothetical protein